MSAIEGTSFFQGVIPVNGNGCITSNGVGWAIPGATVDWQSLPGNLLPPGFSLTRASNGTHFDSAGLLQTAATDVTRETYRYPTTAPRSGQWGQLPGTAGSYFSTPDSAANSITGDIDIRVRCSLPDWTPVGETTLVAKYVFGGQGAWDFAVVGGAAGNLVLYTSPDGTTVRTHSSTATTGITNGEIKWLRATRSATTGVVNFFLSDDGATWTALGTPVTGTVEGVFNSTAGVEIGAINNGGATQAAGNFYAAQVYSGIDGTLAVNFNADDYASGTTWAASTTGETWTVNGVASIAWPWVFDGTMIEQSATNLFADPTAQTVGNFWAGSGLTMTVNNRAWIDGTNKMMRCQWDGTTTPTTGLYTFLGAGTAVTANTEYAVSTDVAFKQGTRGLRLYWCIAGITSGVYVDIDLVNGVVSATTAFGTGSTSGVSRIEPLGNSTYRVTLSGKLDAASTTGFWLPALTKAYQDTGSYSPDAGDGFYVCGMQIELGNASTSRILSAATRNADVVTATTSGLLVNAQGFAAIGYRAIANSAGSECILSTFNAGGMPVRSFFGQLALFDGTDNRAFAVALANTSGTNYKIATTWGGVVCNGAVNGTVGTQQTFDGDMGLGATLRIGDNVSGVSLPLSMVLQSMRLGVVSLTSGGLSAVTQ